MSEGVSHKVQGLEKREGSAEPVARKKGVSDARKTTGYWGSEAERVDGGGLEDMSDKDSVLGTFRLSLLSLLSRPSL